jgi:phage/plasmid-like protein (TIGR03299 family)
MSSSIKSIKIQGLKDWQKSYKESSLNWEVEKRPLFDEKGKKLPVMGTFRSDNNMYIGTVSDKYHIIQNKSLFDIGESIQNAGTNLQLTKEGILSGGQGVYAEFKTPFTFDVGGYGDIYETSLLMRAFHNGSGSVQFSVKTLRLVCTNGMKANRSYHLFNIFHFPGAAAKISSVKSIVNVIRNDIDSFNALMLTFQGVKLDTKQVGNIVQNTLQDKEGKLSTVALGRASVILQKFEHNDNNEFTKQQNTAYALFQSFTNFADHNLSVRKAEGETTEQAQSRGILFGASESLKFTALSEIVKMIRSEFVTVKIPVNSLIESPSSIRI